MDRTFRERAVLLGRTLVLADLHLGRGHVSTVEAPVGDGTDVVERVAELVSAFDPSTVVIAGDVLHAFETVPRGVKRQVSTIQSHVDDAGADLVLVMGNHDTMLDSVFEDSTVGHHWLDETTAVVHGHDGPGVAADRYVLGHDHPAIEIEGRRYPCFLRGPGGPGGTELLVLPAFNRLAAGVVVNGMGADDFQSPLIDDADALAPIVRDPTGGETLRFPPLAEFRSHLD